MLKEVLESLSLSLSIEKAKEIFLKRILLLEIEGNVVGVDLFPS